jgi:hypothetical protein
MNMLLYFLLMIVVHQLIGISQWNLSLEIQSLAQQTHLQIPGMPWRIQVGYTLTTTSRLIRVGQSAEMQLMVNGTEAYPQVAVIDVILQQMAMALARVISPTTLMVTVMWMVERQFSLHLSWTQARLLYLVIPVGTTTVYPVMVKIHRTITSTLTSPAMVVLHG